MESNKMNALREKGETSSTRVDSFCENEEGGKHFPIDIISNILSRLSVKDLMRYTLACKLWYCLIYHPLFIEQHLRRTKEKSSGYLIKRNNRTLRIRNPQEFNPLCFYQDDEEPAQVVQRTEVGGGYFSITDSCDGLICLANFKKYNAIFIYNPVTKDYIKLPKPYPINDTLDIGFAYDTNSGHYKVFRLYKQTINHLSGTRYEVFTLGSTGGWRRKGPIPYRYSIAKHMQADGALHWLYRVGNGKPNLLAIDLSTEAYSVHELPDTDDEERYHPSILEQKGKLSLCLISRYVLEFWVLTDRQTTTWTRKYRINTPEWIATSPFETFGCSVSMRNNKLLICQENQLGFYNLKYGGIEWLDTAPIGPDLVNLHVVEHIETLVPCSNESRWRAARWPEITELA